MLRKSSNSIDAELELRRSPRMWMSIATTVLASACALGLSSVSLPAVAALVVLVCIWTLRLQRRNGFAPGSRLACRGGEWHITGPDGGDHSLVLRPGAVLGRYCMVLPFRDVPGRRSLGLVLTADTCSAEAWRRMRRVLLECLREADRAPV